MFGITKARNPGSSGPRTGAAIKRAGLSLIYRQGFEAMSLRALAAEVGIQPASLYNHIQTKQSFLFDLIREHMEALLASTDAALAKAGPETTDRLQAFIAHHVLYHLEKRQEVFVANFELRALEPRSHAIIVELRQVYEGKLIGLLDAGIASGALAPRDTRITAYAILAMLTGACTWYNPRGRLSRAELVDLHAGLVMKGCLRSDPSSK